MPHQAKRTTIAIWKTTIKRARTERKDPKRRGRATTRTAGSARINTEYLTSIPTPKATPMARQTLRRVKPCESSSKLRQTARMNICPGAML